MNRSIYLLAVFSLPTCTILADSGWSTYLDFVRSLDSAYDDISNGPETADTEWIFGATMYNRTREGQLAADVSYSALNADWSGGIFPVGSGFTFYEEVETLSGSAMWTGLPWDHFGYTVLLGLTSSRVTDGPWSEASITDAIDYTLGAGLNYRFDRSLMVGLVFLYSGGTAGIDGDLDVFPQIYWKFAENWTLQTRQGLLLTWGESGESMDHEIEFSAVVANRQWHLGDNGPLEMAYEEEAFALGLAYGMGFSSGWNLEPKIQYLFDREVNIWADGKRIASSDLESGWRYSFLIEYAF